jgi:predicted glycogen debranching enzyme
MRDRLPDLNAEWLEADGLGGFASGTVGGSRTRRYHAVLLTARRPPTDRMVLVNGFDAWVETASGTWAISSQHYVPGVDSPDGATRLESFAGEPWPIWTWRLPDGAVVRQELFVPHERSAVVLSWTLVAGPSAAYLHVRPFLSGRDYHSLHHENPSFRFTEDRNGQALTWRTYPDVPAIQAVCNGEYRAEPAWYRQFEYAAEHDRGLDDVEDLAAPGLFTWTLTSDQPAVLLLAAEGFEFDPPGAADGVRLLADELRTAETRRRRRLGSPLLRAADAYIVRRDTARTIIAGYPWFTDWGRDTFIALRGMCLAAGRIDDAGRMLAAWAEHVSGGCCPTAFPIMARTPSTIQLTPRCGTSSPHTNT